jgi:REP element-mobilizing transposase RayT
VTYYERNLPHWHPDGKVIFITWRLRGSLPPEAVAKLANSKEPSGRQFVRADRLLDGGRFGPHWLKYPKVATAVKNTILKGSHKLRHYRLLAYAVMPNHVHLLIEPFVPIERITRGIKGVSARRANALLKRKKESFWQAESFDHWVRTSAEGEKICKYIENNPVKAGLVRSPQDWAWSSAARLQ